MVKIDTSFDFRADSGGKDPDKYSPSLKQYHQLLWSRELPNGEFMDLKMRPAPWYLTWKDFDFESDSIIVEMNYEKNGRIIEQVKGIVDDFDSYYENCLHKSYTIGGMIIFPKHRNSMNQRRGMSSIIADRWDLTLECIRRYYGGEDSPLRKVIENDKAFYDLFVDFKGYVDFFFLQDCVSEDYSAVDIWMGDGSFSKSGYPETLEDYYTFIHNEHEFLDRRNKRIKEYCIQHII